MTQANRIISTIRERGELYSWQMTTELMIQQYNARVYDAREILGCSCKFGKNPLCQALEHIVSEKDNKFIYITDQLPENPMSYGYQKFQEAGKKLKGGIRHPYEDLTTQELEAKQKTAETWLKEHKTHTNYAEAVRRYEAICDEITYRQAKEFLE